VNLSSTKASADASTVTNTVAVTATAATRLAISGTQEMTLGSSSLKAAATVDASALSGKLTATFATSVKSYIGSTGADVLTVLAGDLKTGNTFAGGLGTDSLAVTATASQTTGVLAVTGFETIQITSNTAGADVVTADFRNVTDLTTLKVVAGDAGDGFVLNRITDAVTVSVGGDVAAVTTSMQTGTAESLKFTGAATVASYTLDAGTTALTVDAGAAATITTLTGSALSTLNVKGSGALTITDAVTATTVNASTATGALTVLAGNSATSIIGGTAIDTITGGNAADTIQGGKGADVLDGGAGADKFVFEATGALNGLDGLTFVAGAVGDILNFKNFLSGGAVDQNGAAGTAINEYGLADVADVNITNKVALYSEATDADVDDTTNISGLIQGAGDAFSLTSGGKAILLTGDAGGAGDPLNIWFIDDTLDGVSGTLSATDVVNVGVIAITDLDTLLTSNFLFA
jgi:Ca2+-binding RTX toxin-like protein